MQTSLATHIHRNEPFIVDPATEQTTQLDIVTRIANFKNRPFHRERFGRIAAVLSRHLEKKSWKSIEESNKDPLVKTTRTFLRNVSGHYQNDPRIIRCQKLLLASKLNINPIIFDKNPGFEEFARTYHIERYVMHYDHVVKVDPKTHEVKLGAMKWSEIPEGIRNKPSNRNRQNKPWIYGQNGPQSKDMYEWEALTPYKIVDKPEWGNRYIFEYCVCCEDHFRLNGDHSWFRLKTPEGEIYSIGLYRPNKRGTKDNLLLPLRMKVGYLVSPDLSEFYPDPIHTIEMEISAEKFKEMIAAINKEKKNDHNHFHLPELNCTEYANKYARMAGMDLPTKVSAVRYLAPKFLVKLGDKLPNIVQKVLLVAFTPLLNLALLAFGAGSIDHELKKKIKKHSLDIQPHISSFWDLFKPTKLYFHPPSHVAQFIFPEIRAWREKNPENFRYLIPAKFAT